MSYDYDYLVIDWEENSFIIVSGGSEYEYSISEHGDLLKGGLENGVDFTENSHTSQEEQDEPDEDNYDEGYDDENEDDW